MEDGFTTRAIRAATRVPWVDQPPSSVTIHVAVAEDLRAGVENAIIAARAAAAVDVVATTHATA